MHARELLNVWEGEFHASKASLRDGIDALGKSVFIFVANRAGGVGDWDTLERRGG